MTNVEPKIYTRDEIRAQVLKSRQPRKEIIDFFGMMIELRQPTLGDILESANNPNRQDAVIDMLVKYAYVPGTNERIFESTDADE